jgi:hypothetical protein
MLLRESKQVSDLARIHLQRKQQQKLFRPMTVRSNQRTNQHSSRQKPASRNTYSQSMVSGSKCKTQIQSSAEFHLDPRRSNITVDGHKASFEVKFDPL